MAVGQTVFLLHAIKGKGSATRDRSSEELAAFLGDAATMGCAPLVDVSGPLASSLSSPSMEVSGPLASTLSGPPMDVPGPLASSRSCPLMCSTCRPMSFSSPLMSLSGPPMNISGHLVSRPSGASLNVPGPLVSSSSGLCALVNLSGPLVSGLSGLSMNISGPPVSSSSGPCATGLLVNLSGPPISSPSALIVSSDLASSSSGPQELVHIHLSPRLFSNLPSRKCCPYQIYLIYLCKVKYLGRLVKQGFLQVLALKDKERKKQKEAVQKALHFEERSQKKNRRRIVP